MAFDPREAKKLQPGTHLSLPDYPGLRIEASAKFRTWAYRYKSPVDGRMKQVKLGRWPELSLHAAIVAWENLKKRRDAGEDLSETRWAEVSAAKEAQIAKRLEATQQAYTLQLMYNDYVREVIEPRWQASGTKQIQRLFDKMPKDLAATRPEDVQRSQAFALISQIGTETPTVAVKLRQNLAAAHEHALDAGKIPEAAPNWWQSILKRKIKSKGKKIGGEHVGQIKRILEDHEIGPLIRWLPNFMEIISDPLTIYLWTGTRGSEIVAMEGREVVEEAPGCWWWTIPLHKTKNRHRLGATDLRVPLYGRAREIVLRRKAQYGNGWLFPKRDGGHISQQYVKAQVHYRQPYSNWRPEINRLRLEVTHWSPHDLRRTARTLLAKLKCPREVAEAILGHMLPGVEGIYNRYKYDAERQEWLSKLSDHLTQLAVGASPPQPAEVEGEYRTQEDLLPTP